MSDAMSGKTWVDTSPLGRPESGTGWVDHAVPHRSLRRARFPLLDRGLVAFLALVGGLIWLFAGESNPDAAPHPSVLELGKHAGYVESLAFAPDGQTLASCGLDSMVDLWSVGRQGRSQGTSRANLVASLPHSASVIDAAFSPDGRMVVAVGLDSLTFWSHGSGNEELIEQRRGELYRCLAFAPDGRTLAVGLIDGSIQVLDMPGARIRSVLRAYSDQVARLAYSPDGRILASASMRGEVRLWDTATGQDCGRVDPGAGRFHALAFAPDGRTLALAEWQSNEGDILLWDLEANRLRSRLAGHTDGIGQLAFSRDGRMLVSGGRDKKIMFWDPDTTAFLGVIRDAGGMVNCAGPDARRDATGLRHRR